MSQVHVQIAIETMLTAIIQMQICFQERQSADWLHWKAKLSLSQKALFLFALVLSLSLSRSLSLATIEPDRYRCCEKQFEN